MPLKYSIDDLSKAAVETVAENELPHCYLRPVAIRTGEQMDDIEQRIEVRVDDPARRRIDGGGHRR